MSTVTIKPHIGSEVSSTDDLSTITVVPAMFAHDHTNAKIVQKCNFFFHLLFVEFRSQCSSLT